MYLCNVCNHAYGHEVDFHMHLTDDHAFTDDEADEEIERQELDEIPEGYIY